MTTFTLIFFVDPSFRPAAGRVASLNVSMRCSFAKYMAHSASIASVCTSSKASRVYLEAVSIMHSLSSLMVTPQPIDLPPL
jgi:hypothetical protein